MPKAWYEEDDNESVWWKATKKNAHQVCPKWFEEQIGFSPYFLQEGKAIAGLFAIAGGGKVFNRYTPGSEILAKTFSSVEFLAHAGCAASYLGGGLDAWYQVHHDGRHALLDKWDFDVQSLTSLFINGYKKFEKDAQGVQFLLANMSEWWRK